MELNIEVPDTWELERRSDGSRVAKVGAERAVELVIGPVLPMPQNQYPWREQAIHAHLPAGAAVEVGETLDTTTERGWPIRIVEAVVRAADAVIEHRLVCFFHLLEYGCVVTARAPTRQHLDDQRAALRSALRTGWPSWRTEAITAIHELWEGLPWPAWPPRTATSKA